MQQILVVVAVYIRVSLLQSPMAVSSSKTPQVAMKKEREREGGRADPEKKNVATAQGGSGHKRAQLSNEEQ